MPAAVVRGLSRAPARRASGLRRGLPAALSVVLLSAALVVPPARAAVPPPEQDPFYTY
jgi:hypothetical protein